MWTLFVLGVVLVVLVVTVVLLSLMKNERLKSCPHIQRESIRPAEDCNYNN